MDLRVVRYRHVVSTPLWTLRAPTNHYLTGQESPLIEPFGIEMDVFTATTNDFRAYTCRLGCFDLHTGQLSMLSSWAQFAHRPVVVMLRWHR